MTALANAAIALGWGFCLTTAVIVFAQFLSGGINARGLLRVKQPGGAAGVSPARVQLLVATLATAGSWLAAVVSARATGALPEMPTLWLEAVGASQGIYLASKLPKFVPILDALRRVTRREGR